jgi:SAM-dependent methyltransferase
MIVTAMAAPRLFDRKLLLARRIRAERQGAETFLLDAAAGELVERLSAVNRRFALALDLGTPGGVLAAALRQGGEIDRVITSDPLAGSDTGRLPRVAADEEALPFGNETLDLVVSALALQWVNDLPGTFAQIRRALKPDGLFLAALIGGETLGELRESLAVAESEIEGGVSPRVSPFVDVRTLGSLLQRADFALPVTDVERMTVRYRNVRALLHDLQRMGAANALVERSRKPLRREVLKRAEEIYASRFADPDGRLRATFDVLWLSAWAPHESQQKPLKPGSAKMRLADALGTHERPAGEKTGRRPR